MESLVGGVRMCKRRILVKERREKRERESEKNKRKTKKKFSVSQDYETKNTKIKHKNKTQNFSVFNRTCQIQQIFFSKQKTNSKSREEEKEGVTLQTLISPKDVPVTSTKGEERKRRKEKEKKKGK